jgi:ParB family chromosome partitioning protein
MTVTQLHPAGPDADTGRSADPEPSAGQSVVDGVTEGGGPALEEPHLLPLVLADPATLLLTTNVRADSRLDKPFVASVRDHGVLVPIVAHRTAEGELSVLYGARRTLAAMEAGRAQVPVYVVDVPEEGKAREVFRLVRQLVENDHRDPLRDGERVAAYQQLSLLGLTATAIARRVHRRVGEVRSGLAVAGSEVAVAALDRFDLTLAHATVLAEFDGDPDAMKTLTDTARTDPGRFEHVAQRLRDKQATDAARAAVAAELAAAGVRVVEEPPYGDRTVAKLDHLRAGDDAAEDGGAEMAVEAHASCPGHAAYLRDRGAWSGTPDVTAVYVCTDWRGHGHQPRFADSPLTGLSASGRMTAEARAERREVIANNKAWDAARPVRRQWLTAFLARRTAPKDAPQWIAATLASCGHDVRRAMEDGHQTALELLGLATDPPWRPYAGTPNPIVDATAKANPGRATMLTLGLLLGGLESTVTRSTWRHATASQQAYFTALQQWGYPLSDVEQLALARTPELCAEPDADTGAEAISD